MALSQAVRDLILGLMGGDPIHQAEMVDGIEGGSSAIQNPITTDLDFDGNKGTNAADPTDPQDLATKAYVDSGGSGADTALSNLTTVTLNVPLQPSSPSGQDIGTSANPFGTGYFSLLKGANGATVFNLDTGLLNRSTGSTVIDLNQQQLINAGTPGNILNWSDSIIEHNRTATFRGSTTGSGTSPIKLNTGTLMTTPEEGAIEFDGTNLYFTDSTPTRQTISTGGGGSGDIKSDGSVPFAADQSMGGFKLTDLADPTDPQDAATRAYVLANSGGAPTTGSQTITAGGTINSDKDIYFLSLPIDAPGTLGEYNIQTTSAATVTPSSYWSVTSQDIGYPDGFYIYVWHKVDGIGTDPNPGTSVTFLPNYIAIEVDLLSTDTAIQVAAKEYAAIVAADVTEFMTTSNPSGTDTFTIMALLKGGFFASDEGTTGFNFIEIDPGDSISYTSVSTSNGFAIAPGTTVGQELTIILNLSTGKPQGYYAGDTLTIYDGYSVMFTTSSTYLNGITKALQNRNNMSFVWTGETWMEKTENLT